MLTTNMLTIAFLAFLIPYGNSLKCYTSSCINMTMAGKPTQSTCVPQQERNCPLGYDRCNTVRTHMEKPGVIVDSEMRNCTTSSMCNGNVYCNAYKPVSNSYKCQEVCCNRELCNGDGPITTQAPKPSRGPSGSDLSCYSCSSANFKISDVVLPEADCKNPVKQTCGADVIPGTQQDRCLRIKVKKGGSEYEMRTCSGGIYCNKALVCGKANETGELSECNVNCCFGSLCNTGATEKPTPKAACTILTGTLSCLLVMFASIMVLLAEMI